MQLVFTSEPSGRLLKYNPVTKETTVLLRNLQFPNGVSLSKDGTFLVFCEGSRGRLAYVSNLYKFPIFASASFYLNLFLAG